MEFIGNTVLLNITRSNNSVPISLTLSDTKDDGWCGILVYSLNSTIKSKYFTGNNIDKVYENASDWIRDKLDNKANIPKLSVS